MKASAKIIPFTRLRGRVNGACQNSGIVVKFERPLTLTERIKNDYDYFRIDSQNRIRAM